MKMFESVVMAYDQYTMDVAMAVRAPLELFRLNVYAHFCVQKRNIVDFLAGGVPESEYVVLCSHGLGSAGCEDADRMKVGFRVVDQVDGKWEETEFALTPRNIRQYVKLTGRTVIALGCGNGREPLAKAFLDAGCRAYAGAVRPVVEDSTAMFAIAFFYHLLSSDRDSSMSCTERRAAELAVGFDPESKEGTHSFRYYAAES